MSAPRMHGFGTLAVLCALLAAGCATIRPMTLTDDTEHIDTSSESLLLLSARLSNPVSPSWQPELKHVAVLREEPREVFAFEVDEIHVEVEDQYVEYLFGFSLPPGDYVLADLMGDQVGFPPLINAVYSVPLALSFHVPTGRVVYLGHLEAVNRERQHEGELPAGPALGVMDQLVTGYANGTFDVTVSDRYDVDVPLFRQVYPALVGHPIERMVLPAWRRLTQEELDAALK